MRQTARKDARAARAKSVRSAGRRAAKPVARPPAARRAAPSAAARLVDAAGRAWSVAIKIGPRPHRFIRIWAVVVDGRIYARSWSLSAGGWYRTLVVRKTGVLQVADRTAPFRAVQARGESLKAAIDRAYRKKYARPGEVRYARDLCQPASRGSTVELRLEA